MAITSQLKEAADVSLLLYSEGSLSRKQIIEVWEHGATELVAHVRARSREVGQNILSWIPIGKLFNFR